MLSSLSTNCAFIKTRLNNSGEDLWIWVAAKHLYTIGVLCDGFDITVYK